MAEPADTLTPGEDHRAGDSGYQFLTDEIVAMSLALAFYSVFPKN